MLRTTRTTNNNNGALGFLGGAGNGNPGQMLGARVGARRKQRIEQLKAAATTQQLNNGNNATMLYSSGLNKTTNQVQPGNNLNHQIKLPLDVQEKMNRWREKREGRQAAQQVTTQVTTQQDENFEVEQETAQDENIQSIPVANAVMTQPRDATIRRSSDNVPAVMVSQPGVVLPQQSPAPVPPPSLFDSTNQEILKTMVSHEVKQVLDQLKKERPELLNQDEVMTNLNTKTRGFEDTLQQFNVKEQRLRETVDQLNITVKAVQTNIDNFKHETGGAGVTEEVMRSWVSHFFNEQVGVLKKDFQTEIGKLSDKVSASQSGAVNSNSLKTIESNLKLLENKFQNTLQTIYESVAFVYGQVMEEVKVHEKPDSKSKTITKAAVGDRVMLYYPVVKDDNNRWMKVRTVDPESAQLADGYVPVFQNNVVYVGNFKM